MKQIFLTLAVVGLVACQQSEPEIHIMGTQIDFTQDTITVDSLQNVGELLDYLESIPSTHR